MRKNENSMTGLAGRLLKKERPAMGALAAMAVLAAMAAPMAMAASTGTAALRETETLAVFVLKAAAPWMIS